jgi:blocked-early-in-transport protein 1
MNSRTQPIPMRQRPNGNGKNEGDMFNNMESGRGGRGGGRGGMSSHEANANIMEQQNNDRINELSDQVARLKGLTIDIGNEVREQNSLLDNMGDGFSNVGDMLTGSLARMGVMLERGGAKHMCYLVAFVVFVMVFLYWLVK